MPKAQCTGQSHISHFGIFQNRIYPGQHLKDAPPCMARKLTKEKLIAALVRIRKEAELTQQQLAKKLDKPQSYVSKYETGERTLDMIEVIDT